MKKHMKSGSMDAAKAFNKRSILSSQRHKKFAALLFKALAFIAAVILLMSVIATFIDL